MFSVGGSFLDASIDDELDPWEAEEVERLAVLEYQRRAYDERLMDRAQRRRRERESRKKGWAVKTTFLSLLRFRSISPSNRS
jgi:hypothetical protein